MMNEQIAKDAKKRHVPPVGTHSPKHNIVETRIRNLPKSTVALGLLTADAEYLSQQTPAAKYDPKDNLTKPKSFFTKIYEKRKDPDENKIKKSSGPDMGTYDSPRAKDQQGFNRTVRIQPGSLNKKSFFEAAGERKKFVPAPGTYNQEAAYKKLSQSPRAMRINRH